MWCNPDNTSCMTHSVGNAKVVSVRQHHHLRQAAPCTRCQCHCCTFVLWLYTISDYCSMVFQHKWPYMHVLLFYHAAALATGADVTQCVSCCWLCLVIVMHAAFQVNCCMLAVGGCIQQQGCCWAEEMPNTSAAGPIVTTVARGCFYLPLTACSRCCLQVAAAIVCDVVRYFFCTLVILCFCLSCHRDYNTTSLLQDVAVCLQVAAVFVCYVKCYGFCPFACWWCYAFV